MWASSLRFRSRSSLVAQYPLGARSASSASSSLGNASRGLRVSNSSSGKSSGKVTRSVRKTCSRTSRLNVSAARRRQVHSGRKSSAASSASSRAPRRSPWTRATVSGMRADKRKRSSQVPALSAAQQQAPEQKTFWNRWISQVSGGNHGSNSSHNITTAATNTNTTSNNNKKNNRSNSSKDRMQYQSAAWFSSGSGIKNDENNDNIAPRDKMQDEDNDMKWLRRLRMHPDQLVAPEGYRRALQIPASIVNHLCLGSVFAWSIFNQPLMRVHGVVAQAASDWTLGDVALTFSLIMGGFVWGAVFGKYLDRWGPRATCLIGGSCLGAGFALGSAAIATHSLPLLYLGGTVWGLANGWAYVPPVSTLLKWFPDRKGFASGVCILGYGGGAIVAAPLFTELLRKFRKAPEFLGSQDDVHVINQEGKLFAPVSDGTGAGETLKEVVVATAKDVADWGSLAEGVYVVGTGSTGASETLLCLGSGYFATMALASLAYKLPSAGFVPPSLDDKEGDQAASSASSPAKAPAASKPALTTFDVDTQVATRTPQFWLMWAGFGFSVTGAYGVISSGKNILSDAFGSSMPDIVTPAFAASFVAAMGVANLGGRVLWSNISDVIGRMKGGDPFFGRQLTFSAIWGLGPPMYLGIVWAIHKAAEQGTLGQTSMVPLALFSASVFGVLAGFGGTAATRPALTGDLFGTKNVGVLTARQLSVVLPAAMLGPKITTYLRARSVREAVEDLSSQVSDEAFVHAFGAGKDQLDLLLDQKTITISRLMELLPDNVQDPTPFVYDQTMYVMAGLQGLAFLSNQLLSPVDKKYHMKPEDDSDEIIIDADVVAEDILGPGDDASTGSNSTKQ